MGGIPWETVRISELKVFWNGLLIGHFLSLERDKIFAYFHPP